MRSFCRACLSFTREISTLPSPVNRIVSRVLTMIRGHLNLVNGFCRCRCAIDPRVETPKSPRPCSKPPDISVAQLGTTDDCGFAPFSDDTSTSRDTAFAKIRARVSRDSRRSTSTTRVEILDLDEEDKRLRAAALKNVESIQVARQRAERELLEAKETLQRRTDLLEQQREWFEVTLASIGDAVITTDVHGRVAFLIRLPLP